jgi:diguanylate cyclase (GGDEF)-like protein/PAS domain S-box-containing protein
LQQAQLAEPYGYMLKPFSERELRTVLQMAFYKQQAQLRERELAQSNQAILDNMTQGVFTLDIQGRVLSFNKSANTMFAYSSNEVIGHSVLMLLPESVHAQHELLLPHSPSAIDNVICRQRELNGMRKDGSTFPVSLNLSLVVNAGAAAYIGILTDMSQHRLVEEQVNSLTFYDELTGLPNRRRLSDRLALAVSTAAQSDQIGALIYLDLDHFRQINDTLGPGFGDDLLRDVALRLQQCVREEDTVAHFGGDEFMLMLDSLGLDKSLAATRAEGVANKILHALSQPHSLRGHRYISSASVGIVMFDQHAQDTNELLKMADAAMYQAKSAGRNTARFYDPAMQALMVAQTELEKDIQRGLQAQEFVLHYQLQVNACGVPLGAEALVRWQHPQRGLVSPAKFIALAEETGLILQLGQMVLDAACCQLVRWADQPEQADWIMAVNVSALQFTQDDFVDCVAMALELSGANPSLLKLELTESMLVGDVTDVIAKMRSIKAMGVSFSLDDFGTGYSSLAYLKRLPMDQLKIDQSFVRDLLNDPDDAVISQTIVSLGHNLGMQVIAEGVETQGQHDALVAMGCDAFQGYLFARPVAAGELMRGNRKIVL